MQLLCAEDELVCLPITVGEGDSQSGARLGGLRPEGIQPKRGSGRYFATLPFTQDRNTEISLFIAFDFAAMGNASRRILTNADGLLEVLVHEARPRAHDSDAASELSGHPLLIYGTAPDWFVSGGKKVIESGHKIGGRPYIEQPGPSLPAELEKLTSSGFRQFFQIGFPSGHHDATVAGDWPFADGIFHLLVKDRAGTPEFCWFWDFYEPIERERIRSKRASRRVRSGRWRTGTIACPPPAPRDASLVVRRRIGAVAGDGLVDVGDRHGVVEDGSHGGERHPLEKGVERLTGAGRA